MAQRAGISRVTFYRNASGIEDLVPKATRVEMSQAIIRHDPDYLAPFVFHRMGAIQHASRDAMREALAEAGDGSVRADLDIDRAALVLTLGMRPFILGRSFLLDEIDDGALEHELRMLVDGYRRPVG